MGSGLPEGQTDRQKILHIADRIVPALPIVHATDRHSLVG
jgi:hypothetical protein